jgi:hypothetical protein
VTGHTGHSDVDGIFPAVGSRATEGGNVERRQPGLTTGAGGDRYAQFVILGTRDPVEDSNQAGLRVARVPAGHGVRCG